MTTTYRVALVDPDRGIAAALTPKLAIAGLEVVAAHATVAAYRAARERPDAVVLDASAADGRAAEAVRALLEDDPDLCVIVTDGSPAAIAHAVASGARGFLLKPYGADDLVTLVREAFESAHRAPRARARSGRIVAIYGPKGGVGCTTVAVALGVMTAARPGTRTALVDLDLQFGDADAMLDLRSPNSVADVLGHDHLDAAIVDETFVRHSSGLRLLPAPADLARAASIQPAAVERALGELRDHFDVILVDLWSTLDDLTTRVLRAADVVVLVTKPELPALKAMARVLAAHDMHLELGANALVVANRLPCHGGLSAGEVEHSLGHPVDIAIPSDTGAVVDALNRGIPVVDPRVHSRVAAAYRALARAVWAALEPTTRARVEARTRT